MVAVSKPLALVPVPAPAGEQAHASHDHAGHAHAHHGHEHGGHQHGSHGHHAQEHSDNSSRPRAMPRFSLIGLSAMQRLLIALPAIGLLWLLTLWAMHNG